MIEPRSAMPTGAKVGFAATLMALALVAPGPASAQGAGGGGAPGVLPGGPGSRPQQEVNVPPTPAAPSPYQQTRLFGDWDGIRPMLLDHGVDLQLGLVGEWAANASGERLGAGYAGQVAFSADIDWEKLLGIPGFNTHYVMINRHGNNLSQFAYGDNFMQADEVYGAGFNMGIRFVYLYGEEKLFNDRLNIAIGRLPVAVDFAASPLYCIPVALIGCGNPRALTNNGTFTSWPQSTWGGRIRARPTPEIYVQFGAYESKPFPGGGRTGWTWSTAGATGVIMPFEIGWEPIFGPNKLVGHYKVGFSYDTSDFNSLAMGRFGAPLLFPTQTPNITNGRTQFWATADQLIVRQGTSENAGITLLATYGSSTSSNSVTWQTAFAGILDKGFWSRRPDDAIMLSGGWWAVSGQLSGLQQQQFNLGLPLANGAKHPQHNEYGVELDYIAQVYRGVYIEPALQYFIHPNADSQLKNAFVFAGRFVVNF